MDEWMLKQFSGFKMNDVNKSLIGFFVGLLLVGTAHAVTYYVDYSSGLDSNSGLSPTAPFKNAPGDSQATGNAASVVLTPGDIVRFKGGIIYPRQIYIKWSGLSNQHIIYDGNSDNSWGMGRAILDMGHNYNQALTNTWDYGRSYITVQGFEFIRGKNPIYGGARGYIWLGSGSHDWIIRNNVFSKVQNWSVMCEVNGGDNFVNAPAIATREYGDKAYNLIIENNEFYTVGRTAILLRDGYNITVRNNDFGGINRGSETGWFSVALRIELTPHDVLIQNNKFHDGWQYAGDELPDELCHGTDYITMYNAESGATIGPQRITIEKNEFMMDKKFNYHHGTAYINVGALTSETIIRNNLFVNIPGNNLVLFSVTAGNINFTNNIMIMRVHNEIGNTQWYPVFDVTENTRGYINIMNNIFYSDLPSSFGSGYLFYMRRYPFNGTVDYNHYYHAGGKTNPFFINGLGTMNFIQWQSRGFDIHGSYGDPKFVNLPIDPAQSSTGDYRLMADSPAVDKGINLATLGYTNSIDGTTRPQGPAWDIGAYEFVDGAIIYHPADLNQDGCISLGEISAYVSLWLSGSGVSLSQVSSGVNTWMQGC